MDEDLSSEIPGLPQDQGTNKDGALRRPMNAFFIFCKKHRALVRDKNPHLDNRAVTRILGELWASLPPPEKDSYLSLAKQYRDAFMKANPDYHWHAPKKEVLPAFKPASRPGLPSMGFTLQTPPNNKIVPGKLADPSNMGGLGLLLRAGNNVDLKPAASPSPSQQGGLRKEGNNKEMRDGSPEPRGKTSPTFEKSTALLQLAEMCTTGRGEKQHQAVSSQRAEPPTQPRAYRIVSAPLINKPAGSDGKSPIWASANKQGASPVPGIVGKQTAMPKTWSSGLTSQQQVTGIGDNSTSLPSSNRSVSVSDVTKGASAPDSARDVAAKNIQETSKSSHALQQASKRGAETVAGYFQTLERTPLPIAMPLMVNKMIETVLCKDSKDEMEKSKLVKKLECNESLDFDDGDQSSGRPLVSNGTAKSDSDIRPFRLLNEDKNHSESALNPQAASLKRHGAALTFSQIQETLIRKAMEDSNLVTTQQPPPPSQPITHHRVEMTSVKTSDNVEGVDFERQKHLSNFTQSQLDSQSHTHRDIQKTKGIKLESPPVVTGNRCSTVYANWADREHKQERMKTELPLKPEPEEKKPCGFFQPEGWAGFQESTPVQRTSEKISEFDSYRKTMSQILETSIKNEIEMKSNTSYFEEKSEAGRRKIESGGKNSDSMDLTCKEEFKDSESESPHQEINAVSDQSSKSKDFDKLRYQIESQLTSHLMASAGVLNTYEEQRRKDITEPEHSAVSRDRGKLKPDNGIHAPDIESKDKSATNDIRSSKTCDKTLSTHASSGIMLPPKKRGLRYLQEGDKYGLCSGSSESVTQNEGSENCRSESSAVSKTKLRGKSRSRESPKAPGQQAEKLTNQPAGDSMANQRSRRRRRNAAEIASDPYGERLSPQDTKFPGSDMLDPDEDPLDGNGDDDSGVRKSKRRNRGLKYQELLSKGLLQVGRQKRADSTSESVEVDTSQVRRRKRTVSETNLRGGQDDMSPNFKKVVGGFDLDAHLAEMPSCHIDNSKQNSIPKSSIRTRSRHRSGSSAAPAVDLKTSRAPPVGTSRASRDSPEELTKGGSRGQQVKGKPDVKGKGGKKVDSKKAFPYGEEKKSDFAQCKDLNIAELRQTQLQKNTPALPAVPCHVTGSQKRKQRRCPITHLHQLSKVKDKSQAEGSAMETNNNQNKSSDNKGALSLKVLSVYPTASHTGSASVPSPAASHTGKATVSSPAASHTGSASPHASVNLNFATLLDVAVAETEKLLRQSNGTELTVSCN